MATSHNTRLVIQIQKDYNSFDRYIWRFRDEKRAKHQCKDYSELPTESEESRAMSKELKKMGFKFVGSTICYAFMQAVGMVIDHLVQCFRHDQI